MNLYWLKTERKFVRTQAEAKAAGQEWELKEIPTTTKEGTIAFLNDFIKEQEGSKPDVEVIVAKPPRDFSATATLSRVDNPGVDVDAICETIGRSKGYALKRYAGAVAVAFQILEKK